jgi:endogenous inhibitor of DNA gyrase (YacG/DUF329 family)
MSNKSTNEKLQELRNEYRSASPERQGKIIEEANELKKHVVKCSQCHDPLPQDDDREYGFCSEGCREIYWVNAKTGNKSLSYMQKQAKSWKLNTDMEENEKPAIPEDAQEIFKA